MRADKKKKRSSAIGFKSIALKANVSREIEAKLAFVDTRESATVRVSATVDKDTAKTERVNAILLTEILSRAGTRADGPAPDPNNADGKKGRLSTTPKTEMLPLMKGANLSWGCRKMQLSKLTPEMLKSIVGGTQVSFEADKSVQTSSMLLPA